MRSPEGGSVRRCGPAVLAVLAALVATDLPAASRSKSSDALRIYRLAQTEYEAGKTQKAIESLQRAIDLDAKLAEAHHFLGIIYLDQSDPGSALKPLRRALAINPYFTDARNTLGVCYRKLKKYKRSQEEFQAALKDRTYATPEKIYLNLGYLDLDRERPADAVRQFETAVQKRPNYLGAFLGLMVAYQRMGRLDLAEQQFRKIVQIGPDSTEAVRAKEILAGGGKRDGS